MNISEHIYIYYRKVKAGLSWFVYAGCSIFPVQQKKIVFSAFEGGGYGCNPKYIAEEFIRRIHEENKNYELVWLVNDLTKKFPVEIHKVKNTLLNRAYHLSTAKVWVDNARKNYGTRKRKGQLYIQTWHGQVGLKPVGKLRGKSFSKIAQIVTKADAELVDYFLVDSIWTKDMFARSFYGENFVLTGSPRCDVLLREKKSKYFEIRKRWGIPQDAKIFMYAPTFRGGSQSKVRNISENQISLDFERLFQALKEKFDGEWYGLLRLHPQISTNQEYMLGESQFTRLFDISKEADMYEYLAATDIFISDYTSAESEAALINIPVFIYADDLDLYIRDRGNFVFDIYREIPYPVAKNNDELVCNIKYFNRDVYQESVKNFFEKIGMFEDGYASERVVKLIQNYINGEEQLI